MINCVSIIINIIINYFLSTKIIYSTDIEHSKSIMVVFSGTLIPEQFELT